MAIVKFDCNSFLDEIEKGGEHVCIDEVVFTWNGNHWDAVSDKYGEAFVLDWIKEKFPASVSRSVVRQAWETLKIDLLNREQKRVLGDVVIPCQGSYVHIDNSGRVTVTSPDKSLYCTHALACEYEPHIGVTPMFSAFLEKILPDTEVRNRVQEFVGYTLLNDTRYQRASLWLGSGANGKGVLSNIVQALHAKVQAIQLDNTSRFALSGLFQASLIIADELPARKLDEAKLKSMIAGEKVFVDIKCQSPITTTILGKLLVLGNNYPVVDDASEGFWRRWDVVPFDVTIPAAERDPRLAQKIIDGELSGVLNWAIEGLQRLLSRDGFEPVSPVAMQLAINKAKAVTNDVTGWLSERVVSVAGVPLTHKTDVYSDYVRWCSDNDFVPQTQQGFWLKLKRSRTDLSDKKVRSGAGFKYVCSINLKPKTDAANADEFVAAA